MRRPHLATNRVAGFEVKFADLRRRNVNVVRARKIVVVGGAEEAVPVRQDFKHAFCENMAFLFALRLENFENQVLLTHAAGAGKVERAGNLGQLGYVLFFEFCDGH